MKPVVDRLRQEFDGEVAFTLVNMDADPQASSLGSEYAIRFVPTFVFLDSKGDEVEQRVGAIDEDVLRDALEALE
jgi:thioredoxin-like negative regulator of GroEL